MSGPATETAARLGHVAPSPAPSSSSETERSRPSDRPPLGRSFKTPFWHTAAEKIITLMAFSAIAAIVLIFVFIAREALPMFWEASFANEVSFRDLFFSKHWSGYAE